MVKENPCISVAQLVDEAMSALDRYYTLDKG